MNIENLRDPNLWEYVGRRITNLGGKVGIFDLDQEGDATEVTAIVCEILANTVHGPAEEWRPSAVKPVVSAGSPRGIGEWFPPYVAVAGLRTEYWVWQFQRPDGTWVDMHPYPFATRCEAEAAFTPPAQAAASTAAASQTPYRLVGRADIEVIR